MPTSYETLSRTHHGDYTQTTTMDCEEGSLRLTIGGPSGSFELAIESPDDLPAQAKQLDELAAALADARAMLASFLETTAGGGQP